MGSLNKVFGTLESGQSFIDDNKFLENKLIDSKPLDKKKVFVDDTVGRLKGVTNLITKLGGKISGVGVPEINTENANLIIGLESLEPNVTFVIGYGQPFEKANVLAKTESNYLLGKGTDLTYALEVGAKPISLNQISIFGFDGVVNLLNKVIETESLYDTIKNCKEKTSYTQNWLRRSSNWYVKQEVK